MDGSITPPRFVTLSTSSLQIQIKSPAATRSPSRSPVRSTSGFVRSSSARYSRKDDLMTSQKCCENELLAPPKAIRTTGSRTGTRSLSPRPDRASGYSGPPPPSPNSGARFGSGFPFLPTRAPTPPQQLSSAPDHQDVDPEISDPESDRTSDVLKSVSRQLNKEVTPKEFSVLDPIEEKVLVNRNSNPTLRPTALTPNRGRSESGKPRLAVPSPNRLGTNSDAAKPRSVSSSPNRIGGNTKATSISVSLSPCRGRSADNTSGKQRSVSPSPSRFVSGTSRSTSPNPCRLGAVSPSTFATSFSQHVTSPTFLGKYTREANNNKANTNTNTNTNNNNNNKDPQQQRIVKPIFQLTPPCGRKFGTATMSADRSDSPDRVKNNNSNNNHSSIAGTLMSVAATTATFHLENNNNNNNGKIMTPPASRKFGTSSPVPQTLPPNDPLLSYPFCPYKMSSDEDSMPGRASQILTFDSFKINLSYSMFL